MFLLGPAAGALEPTQGDGFVVPVSYTTGQAGSRLAWLPYRPTPGELRQARANDGDAGVIQTDFRAPSRSSQTAAADPMSDPFGDGNTPSPSSPTLGPEQKTFTPEFLDPTTLPEDPDALAADSTKARRVPESNIPAPLLEQGLGTTSGEPERLPTLDEELAKNVIREDGCPKTNSFKPISELTTDVRASSGDFPVQCGLKEEPFNPRDWTPTTFTWKASGLCHKPLYFEQIQLERYGHSFGPYVQPLVSHAHFFVTVPMLPYLMGVNPPNECMYTLGYYRPGSCAPYMLDPLPLSVRGALWEAGAWVGGAALVP